MIMKIKITSEHQISFISIQRTSLIYLSYAFFPKGSVRFLFFVCVHVHIVGMTRYQKVTDSCDSYLDRIQEIKEAVVSLGVSKHA